MPTKKPAAHAIKSKKHESPAALPATSVVLSGLPPTPANVGEYDPVYGQAAFTALHPTIAAVTLAGTRVPRADAQRGAQRALSLAKVVLEPTMRARFDSLPESEFSHAQLDQIVAYASAVIYAYGQKQVAQASETTTKVPPELAAVSFEVEKRMQTLLEYHLSDDPIAGPILAYLAPGTDYRDRANDLLGYADLYEKYPAVVSGDMKHYRTTDVADARKLAGELLAHLGAAELPSVHVEAEDLAKALMLLRPCFDDIRETLLWLTRASDPDAAAKYPTLFSIGRRAHVATPVLPVVPSDAGTTTDATGGM